MFIGQTNCHIADSINQLQCGNECIVFKSAAENTELNGFSVLQINAGVTTAVVAFLGVVKDFLGLFFVAISGGPAFQLKSISSAESQ